MRTPIFVNSTWWIIACILIFSFYSNAQDFKDLPDTVEDHQIVSYTQFILSCNEEHEQPDRVAHELTGEEASIHRTRCVCFHIDHKIITGNSNSSYYSSTGFDQGLLCPAADNNMSEETNRQSFLMSNMSPQLPSFNRGIWADLEYWVRQQAIIYDMIYVVTGPAFIYNLSKIGNNKVTMPGYFYKIILRFEGSAPKTIAFHLPQIGCTGKTDGYVETVSTIETLTGLNVFHALHNSIEDKVESQYFKNQWGF